MKNQRKKNKIMNDSNTMKIKIKMIVLIMFVTANEGHANNFRQLSAMK